MSRLAPKTLSEAKDILNQEREHFKSHCLECEKCEYPKAHCARGSHHYQEISRADHALRQIIRKLEKLR